MSDSLRRQFTLRDLLHEQLRDLYDAEMRYSGLLSEMIDRATGVDLKELLREIAGRTQDNVTHLSHACTTLRLEPGNVTCEAMKGLVREAKDHASDWGDSATQDAALIANAQRIVHYEIAGFGTAREFARLLKLDEAAEILADLLKHAVSTDKALTKVARGGWFTPGVNQEAIAGAA